MLLVRISPGVRCGVLEQDPSSSLLKKYWFNPGKRPDVAINLLTWGIKLQPKQALRVQIILGSVRVVA